MGFREKNNLLRFCDDQGFGLSCGHISLRDIGRVTSLVSWGGDKHGLLTDTTHSSDTLYYAEHTVTWFFLFHFWTPPECMFVFFGHAPVPVFP